MLRLFLTQAAIGSVLVLLLVPPRAAGRKFFRYAVAQSTAILILGLALEAGAGAYGSLPMGLFFAAALLLGCSAGLFHVGRLETGFLCMAFALLPGMAAVTLEATSFMPAHDTSPASHLLYPSDALTAGLLLGSVLIAMILGHFYLNIPGLSIDHLKRLSIVVLAATGARLLVVAISAVRHREGLVPLVALFFDGTGPVPEGAQDPFVLVLLLMHLVVGILGPAVLAFMTWRAAGISSTQSATGILYVALVLVIMGEMASRYLLTFTRLPL
ncbi:MAG TPA: hypothetical protein VFG76_02285 [Candidatus Polarisedimenticolia bacterium]|nr:hypothetical protein [Candidatus Polarisedimenticolia bacterium]